MIPPRQLSVDALAMSAPFPSAMPSKVLVLSKSYEQTSALVDSAQAMLRLAKVLSGEVRQHALKTGPEMARGRGLTAHAEAFVPLATLTEKVGNRACNWRGRWWLYSGASSKVAPRLRHMRDIHTAAN